MLLYGLNPTEKAKYDFALGRSMVIVFEING